MGVDDFVTLLQVDGASGFGVLLAAVVLVALAINKEWLVTGARYRKDSGRYEEAAKAANEALKLCEKDYVEARIAIARHEEREHFAALHTPAARKRTNTP